MKNILVIAEHDHATLKTATLNTVSAAQSIGGEIHMLVAGNHCAGAAAASAKIPGIAKVLQVDAGHYAHHLAEDLAVLAEDLAVLIAGLAKDYSHVLAPATTFGKNLMPRVAALLDVTQLSDIVGVESADTFVRPIYAGSLLATVQCSAPVKVITVRSTAFAAAASEGGTALIETVPAAAPLDVARFAGQELTQSERPELTAARIVISGGRGMGSGEDFKLARGKTSSFWKTSPTSSARRWAPRARQWTPVLRPTITRSARPARSSRPNSISPWVFPALSSTWPE